MRRHQCLSQFNADAIGLKRIDEAHLNARYQIAPLQVPLCSREGYVD